jgi:predicted RNA-binding protein YlqC (UPF0109 family)
MKSLLEYLVKKIVNDPDKIVIEKREEGESENFYLKTSPQDRGKIIGKKGKTIKALRSLLRLKGLLEKRRVNLYLVEPEKEKETSSA